MDNSYFLLKVIYIYIVNSFFIYLKHFIYLKYKTYNSLLLLLRRKCHCTVSFLARGSFSHLCIFFMLFCKFLMQAFSVQVLHFRRIALLDHYLTWSLPTSSPNHSSVIVKRKFVTATLSSQSLSRKCCSHLLVVTFK